MSGEGTVHLSLTPLQLDQQFLNWPQLKLPEPSLLPNLLEERRQLGRKIRQLSQPWTWAPGQVSQNTHCSGFFEMMILQICLRSWSREWSGSGWRGWPGWWWGLIADTRSWMIKIFHYTLIQLVKNSSWVCLLIVSVKTLQSIPSKR